MSLGIFGCLLFNVVQYNRLVSNELDFKIWDMQTVTLNDYTVELKIDDKMWTDFKK